MMGIVFWLRHGDLAFTFYREAAESAEDFFHFSLISFNSSGLNYFINSFVYRVF
jgi:hypothetical protein